MEDENGPNLDLGEEKDFMSENFGVVGYLCFAGVFLVSTAIGVFHGCWASRGKEKTAEGYLIGNRTMSSAPVALSLLCSVVSAITMLGDPVEIYSYGVQYSFVAISFIPLTFTILYLYIPVYYNLRISSAYEYLDLRFGPKTRVFVSLLSCFSLILYMSIVVYGPSLALVQVTGMSSRLTTAIIFMICIFYSTLGGFKTVVWTDAFQAVVMLGSMLALVVTGIGHVGGMGVVWQRLENTNRNNFFNFDLDPRTRTTVWSVLARYFLWLTIYGTSQSQVQRYLSLPSLTHCKNAMLINMVGLVFTSLLTTMVGVVIYAKYFDCDPLEAKAITSYNQLLPRFVLETSSGILPGLVVAGVTCASLSTVSSGLSALSSVFTYDYLKRYRPKWDEKRLFYCSQVACLVFGVISFLFVFVAENLGSILPAAGSLLAVMGGPTLGIFTLGMFFPFTNVKGAMSGMITTIILMACLVIGTFVANANGWVPNQRLFTTTEGCNNTDSFTENLFVTSEINSSSWKSDVATLENDSLFVRIVSISFLWHPPLGVLLTIFFGIIFSLIFNNCNGKGIKIQRVRPNLLSPPILKLWLKVFPKVAEKWIDFESENKVETGVKLDAF